MAKIIDRIIQSECEPKQTNVLWDKNGELYIYRNDEWQLLTVGEQVVIDLSSAIKEISEKLEQYGFSSYLHKAYSNSSDGSLDFSIEDSQRDYLGLYIDNNFESSLDPSKYQWTKIKGEQGEKGDRGIDGTNGVDGTVGTNTYFHIKFSNSPDGIPMNDTDGTYMGTYVDYTLADSDDPSKYTWVKIKGENGIPGEKGIPGENGADGKTSYLHIAYANSPDGTVDFSITEADDKIYIGQYVDFEELDSYDPYMYKWSRIQGTKGDSAIQFYTWLRYADTIEFDDGGNAVSGTGISNNPMNEDGTFKKYMGFAYKQVVAEESDVYSDYTWHLTTGADGKDGLNGESGYLWIKYADKIPVSSDEVYDEPTETTEYIGINPNATTKEESYNPADYQWSKFKGDQGIPGEKGDKGDDGKSYEYIYKLTTNKDDVPNISGIESPNEDDYVPDGWEDNARGVSEDFKAEWCCTRIKVDGEWGKWKGPSLWSTYGETGKDGGDIQYIYKRTAVEVFPDNPTPIDYISNDQYQGKGEFINSEEYVPIGWSDDPQGVSETIPFEWTCVRKKKDGLWQAYKGPSLWSKYGKDGKDGTSIKIKGYVETTSDLPLLPEDPNDCYVVGTDLYIWDATYWKNVGPFKGENGADGISIEWKGDFTSHPLNPEEGWAYRNTTTKASYIYRNGTWNVLVSDGEAPYILELSNDADSVNCDYNGNIIDSVYPSCIASLYHGTNKIDSGVTFSISTDDTAAKGITIRSNGELSFSSGYSFLKKVIRITITAKYTAANVTISKVFTLSKNIPGNPGADATKLFLTPSASVISVDKNNVATPNTISIRCYKQIGANAPVEDTSTTIYWGYDTNTPTIGTTSGASTITVDKTKKYLTFALKNSKNEFYEIEKVPIIYDGKDGSDGKSITVAGTFNTETELKNEYPNGPENISHAYVVGKDLYIWDGSVWNNVGQFKGDDGRSKFLHVAFASSEDGSRDFSTTDDSGRTYIGQYVDEIEDDSEDYTDYKWKKYVGTGISSTTVTYGVSTNTTDKPSEWSPTVPAVPKGYYLWTRTVTDYTDPSIPDTTTYSYSYQGEDGDTGPSGNGINSITVKYAVNNSYTTAPTTWYTTPPTTSPTNKYLWQQQTIDFTNQTDKVITQVVATHGETGAQGEAGKGIQNIVVYYSARSTKSAPEIGSLLWSTDPTNSVATLTSVLKYLYSYTKTVYTDGTTINSVPALIGVWGNTGTQGKAGKTVYPAGEYDVNVTYTSTDNTTPYVIFDGEYYQLNTSSWTGSSQTYKNPKLDIDAGRTNWVKFDKFEALFAKVGVIDNGTFGAAVFSGNYMFSQYGKTTKGGTTHTSEYKYFNSSNPYGSGNTFYPNVCLNFLTGEAWFNAGNIYMSQSQIDFGSLFNFNGNRCIFNTSKDSFNTTYNNFSIKPGGEVIWDTTLAFAGQHVTINAASHLQLGSVTLTRSMNDDTMSLTLNMNSVNPSKVTKYFELDINPSGSGTLYIYIQKSSNKIPIYSKGTTTPIKLSVFKGPSNIEWGIIEYSKAGSMTAQ